MFFSDDEFTVIYRNSEGDVDDDNNEEDIEEEKTDNQPEIIDKDIREDAEIIQEKRRRELCSGSLSLESIAHQWQERSEAGPCQQEVEIDPEGEHQRPETKSSIEVQAQEESATQEDVQVDTDSSSLSVIGSQYNISVRCSISNICLRGSISNLTIRSNHGSTALKQHQQNEEENSKDRIDHQVSEVAKSESIRVLEYASSICFSSESNKSSAAHNNTEVTGTDSDLELENLPDLQNQSNMPEDIFFSSIIMQLFNDIDNDEYEEIIEKADFEKMEKESKYFYTTLKN